MKYSNLSRKLIADHRKPKPKFTSREQKHHYYQAVKHYGGMKQATRARDMGRAEKHIESAWHHINAGKLNSYHRDRMQHESNHLPPHTSPDVVPYQKRKRKKGKVIIKKGKIFLHRGLR